MLRILSPLLFLAILPGRPCEHVRQRQPPLTALSLPTLPTLLSCPPAPGSGSEQPARESTLERCSGKSDVYTEGEGSPSSFPRTQWQEVRRGRSCVDSSSCGQAVL